MCQQACLETLKKNDKWMTARDIEAKIRNISIGSIQSNLKKLKKHKLIKAKKSKTMTKNNNPIPVTKYRAKK